jgi:hypothetical protein
MGTVSGAARTHVTVGGLIAQPQEQFINGPAIHAEPVR